MMQPAAIPDPCDVPAINDQVRAWAGRADHIRPVQIKQICVADDALDSLEAIVTDLACDGPTLIVADHTPMLRSGEDLKAVVRQTLSRKHAVRLRHLPARTVESWTADLESAQVLAGELPGCGAVVSVGSGSITDVVKYARHLATEEHGARIPFVAFPTAASVTAYTSALAVLTVDGVKRTLPARAPDAVVCDLRTLADAPRVMTQAGFGDVLARSVSYGDWYLAAQLGMADGFSMVPGQLLAASEEAMVDHAEAIARGEMSGVRRLTEAILLAGMAMSLVNDTAPLSGWEHAISHFLDLNAKGTGRRTALHGGQVGVATRVAARAYALRNEVDVGALDKDLDEQRWMHEIEQVFGGWAAGGALLAEIRRDVDKKLGRRRERAAKRKSFIEQWQRGEFEQFILSQVRSPAQIDAALQRAGAPRRFSGLDEPIPEQAAFAAVSHAHLIRARFTLGDLLAWAGWLRPQAVQELVDGVL